MTTNFLLEILWECLLVSVLDVSLIETSNNQWKQYSERLSEY